MKDPFKRQLWISFSVVFFSIAASTAALYFLSGNLTTLADKIVADKTLMAKQATAVDVLARLKSDAPQAAPYAVAMNKLLPTHDELIGFSEWLNKLAKAHAVSADFSFRGTSAEAGDSSPGRDAFSLNATGPSANILAFLEDFEATAPGFLLTISSFDVVSGGASYQLSVQGELFSR